jgi:acyl-CoA synthetase (AMP-forming)/AMP-acid ligase II
VPLNHRLAEAEIRYLLADCGARVLVCDQDRLDVALAAIAGAELPPELFVVAEGMPSSAAEAPGVVAGWEAALLVTAGPPPLTTATVQAWEPTQPALIMYTSGTTGRPKGAVLTYLNLLMQTLTRARNTRQGIADDVVLLASPLFHIAGLGALIPSLLLGHTVVLAAEGSFDPAATLDLIEAQGVTTVFLVPTQWQALCEQADIAGRDLKLRYISWGASPALPSTLEAMAGAFPDVPMVATFGQTEMSPITCALSGEEAVRKLGSVGRPVATVDIRIVDEQMNDVGPGQVGEIVYRGPGMMSGYWNNAEATAESLHGGWFHSGDLVRSDEEGFVYVVDRKKDMIISGGENIYSAEVEDVIQSHPKVRDVAVVGVPHPVWVETPAAIIVAADPADPPTSVEIVDWVRSRLASYKKPTIVEMVDALPRNAAGKVLKRALRERLATADGTSDPTTTSQEGRQA